MNKEQLEIELQIAYSAGQFSAQANENINSMRDNLTLNKQFDELHGFFELSSAERVIIRINLMKQWLAGYRHYKEDAA